MVERVHQNVLIVSGETETTRLALELLAGRGIRGAVARDARSADECLRRRWWDLILLDRDGMDAQAFDMLHQVRSSFPEMPVVMAGAQPGPAEIVRAIREGCLDYLVKPIARATLEDLLGRTLPNHEVSLAAAEEADGRCLYQIAGRSPKFLETLRVARKVAPTSVPVLITGESGTGKELISFLIHSQSRRGSGPYIRVNCAAVSESLLESELFGHERGAFTGAIAQRKGRFERAHGGTLLLDEVSETGPRLQAELLRVLEQQDFERVGGSEPIQVNVRVICTSNRDLLADVERGKFRRDLYYRICGVRLNVPALRERLEDIPVLTWHFVNQYAREVHRRIESLDEGLLNLFLRYCWPGNVRQLRNVVRTALVLGEGPRLSLAGAPDLRAELQAPPSLRGELLSVHLPDLERQAIYEALRRTQSNQTKAARLLGITDRTLREKLRRYRQDGRETAVGEGTWQRVPV
jgi:DNA-binding NtrC family response regulator